MMLVRRVARPMLASIFVYSGAKNIRNPEVVAPTAEKVTEPVKKQLSALPQDTETLVRINGGVQVVAGTMLALGRFPRLSAIALVGSLVPTTAAAHRFWEVDDPAQRSQQTIHFLKNCGLSGGLLLAAVDTEGRPSVGWRARRAARRAAERARSVAH
jgi:uncharacterized membrane protein YphA (DoxX/SURF4 family)